MAESLLLLSLADASSSSCVGSDSFVVGSDSLVIVTKRTAGGFHVGSDLIIDDHHLIGTSISKHRYKALWKIGVG
jgi:hypothetical protein